MYERPRGFRGLFRSLEEKVHPVPLKERVDQALYRLATQKEKLEHMSSRLQQRDKEMFQRCIGAQLSKDNTHAALYANECADVQTSSDEAKKVLEESSVIASQQMKERFPELPTPEPRQATVIARHQVPEPPIPIAVTSGGVEEISRPPLEERVLGYIKAHNGELSVTSAYDDLDVPPEDIRQSLQKLRDDGKIVMD